MQNSSRPIDVRTAARIVLLLPSLLLLPACGDDDLPPLRAGEADHWAHAVSHILVRVAQDGRDEPAARERIYEVYEELRAGASFDSLARRHSAHESRQDGGFIGFVPVGPDTRFSGAVQALEPGETSRPVRTDLGYQIVHRHPLDEGIELERRLMVAVYGFTLPYHEIQPAARYSEGEARELAARIFRECQAGATTLEAAKRDHTDPDPRGRDDAFLFITADRPSLHDLYVRVRDVAEGEHVAPFDTPGGIALVRRGRMLRVVARHIVVKHRESAQRPLHVSRSRDEARARAQEALRELAPDRSNWASLVQKYTDDDTTLRPLGEVGLVGPGEMPLPIERALAETGSGEVHPQVVESLFGFHVLWRVR